MYQIVKCFLNLLIKGFGGGYMEREENVQYKERDDSDSEFDEVFLICRYRYINII